MRSLFPNGKENSMRCPSLNKESMQSEDAHFITRCRFPSVFDQRSGLSKADQSCVMMAWLLGLVGLIDWLMELGWHARLKWGQSWGGCWGWRPWGRSWPGPPEQTKIMHLNCLSQWEFLVRRSQDGVLVFLKIMLVPKSQPNTIVLIPEMKFTKSKTGLNT